MPWSRPEKKYEEIGTDENGEKRYGYVETGRIKTETGHHTVYEQELSDLDIGELATYQSPESRY